MQKPYQLILDFWEGNPDVDPLILTENGVVGMLVRINSMSGGHHMDDRFHQNWALAKTFPIQGIYFVYNPWVSGKVNFDWLIAHMPSDYGKRRLFIDIEVRYPGYSPVAYAIETAKFMAMVRQRYPGTRYSGGGFLDILKPWPVDEEYWWAAYSDDLTASTGWEDYKRILEYISYSAFTKLSPGRCRLWQATGDGLRLPGFGDHAVDVNVFPGTLEEALAWFGCELNNTDEEEQVMGNPMGLFTRKAGWTVNNPNFNFVAGAAQVKNTADPNPEIKPIEQEAIAGKIPMFLWWDHLPFLYSEQQWGERNWPNESNDYPFQNLKTIMANRMYNAVVISVNTYKMRNGEDEDPGFLAFSARSILNRVQSWLKTNRPMVPLILACTDAFMTAHAPDMKNWAHNFSNMSMDSSLISKADSYPIAGAKPNYLGNSLECPWWRYYEMTDKALLLFRGERGYPPTLSGMAQWLNIDPSVPPPPPKPPVDPNATEFDRLKLKVETLEVMLEKVVAALKKPVLS